MVQRFDLWCFAKVASAAALVVGSSTSMAASTYLSTGCTQSSAGTTVTSPAAGVGTIVVGNQYTCAGSTASEALTVSAFGANNDTPATFTTARLASYTGGFGVQSRLDPNSSPEHSIDNNPLNAPDVVLLSFGTSVILDSVKLGWWSGDADVTVLAYTGSGTPVVSGYNASNLTTAGWTAVKSLGDNDADPAAPKVTGTPITYNNVNTTGVSSSYWLISAYNSAYGGNSLTDTVTDNFKLLSVATRNPTYTPPGGKVPVPGSLALVSLALVSGFAVRRRQQAAQG